MAKGSNNTRNINPSTAKYKIDGNDIEKMPDEAFFSLVRQQYSGTEGELHLINLLNKGKKPTLIDDITDKELQKSYNKEIIYRGFINGAHANSEKIGEGRVGTGLFGNGYYYTTSKQRAENFANGGSLTTGLLKSSTKVISYIDALKGGVDNGVGIATYAMKKGYDAMKIDVGNGESYYLVFNKEKLLLKK